MGTFTGNRFKYNERELINRGISVNIVALDVKWRVKKATYTNEGVWLDYVSLRNSFWAMFKDANNINDNNQCTFAAQVVMDAFLIRRCRGEDIHVPREACFVTAAPGEDEPLAMLDASVFEGKKEVSENEKLRWVFENMQIAGIEPSMAPSAGAWALLQELRASNDQRRDFYKTLWPKLLAKEDTERGGRLADSGKEAIELIERLQAALESEE